MKTKLLFSTLALLSFFGTTFTAFLPSSNHQVIAQTQRPQAYLDALEDVVITEDHEVLENLSVVDSDQLVNVARLIREGDLKKGDLITPPSSSSKDPKVIWVTVTPELYDFCKRYKNANSEITTDQLNYRLKQLLGVPADSNYTHVAIISVNSKYLKRVAYNPDPTSYSREENLRNAQDSSFPENVDDDFRHWFIKQIQSRTNIGNVNINTKSNLYPWTGLGYTYDWSPKTRLQTDAGLSEFVIFLPPNTQLSSPIKVEDVLSTEEYCL
ncbi:MAG: hypothetical protein VKN60_02350 [Cyanobacteriota bacterium]|nr:hypothetical protein [Cyanobacteriota bacterium]